MTANPIGLARFGGPVSAMPWQYASLGEVGRPAQGPDGTIYAIEMVPGVQTNGYPIGDRAVLVLDGATRQVRARVPLPRSVVEFHAQWATHPVFGHPCPSDRWESAPVTTAPIVAENGDAFGGQRIASRQRASRSSNWRRRSLCPRASSIRRSVSSICVR